MSQFLQTLQDAKETVLGYYSDLDSAAPDAIEAVIDRHSTDDYSWRGSYPFYDQPSPGAAAKSFYEPLVSAMAPLQRRPDIFMAGYNNVTCSDSQSGPEGEVWVCQMGHLLGLFDAPWLGIPPTHRMCFVRYAEFHRVVSGRIAETALFTDVISVMKQAGHYPLPPSTGSSHIHPGPLTHDGVMLSAQDPDMGRVTIELTERMILDLNEANRIAAETGENWMAPDVLRRTWHEDMIWSGSEGIGASYTIARYQQQHSYPFRFNLADKVFDGHVARFSEGNYAAWFGWPNLRNRATGGFLGMTANTESVEMRVVDVYRRDGDKLAENWVFLDLGHWLAQQGLDVLQRMRQMLGSEGF